VRKGEIWLVEYDDPARSGEPSKVRPAVIVSADGFNTSGAGNVVTVPLTTSVRHHPLHVEIDDERLGEIGYAQVELVGAVSRERIVARLGAVGPVEMAGIGARLRLLLDL
jgi:mRNA interferase MazF